jgi:hypothetical protein
MSPPLTGPVTLGPIDFDEVHNFGIPDGPGYPSLVFHLRGVDARLEPAAFLLDTSISDELSDRELFIPAAAVTPAEGEVLVRFPPFAEGATGRQWLPWDDDAHELFVLVAGMPVAHRSLTLHRRTGSTLPRERRPTWPWLLGGLLAAILLGTLWRVLRRR